MTKEKQRPAKTLRDGNIKLTIWRNESEKGAYYSLDHSRSYKDADDNYQDTRSVSGAEALRVAHLYTKAYDVISELRANNANAEGEGAA